MSLSDRLWCFARGHQFSPSDEFDHLGITVDQCDRCGKRLVLPAKDR